MLRDVIGCMENTRESRVALNEGKVLVNGKPRKSVRFPVCLFDIVELPDLEKRFEVYYNELGKISVREVEDKDYRLARIEGKTILKGGKTQLNLFASSNVLADKKNYTVGDVLKLGLEDGKIKGKIKLEEGENALIIEGRHRGKSGRISEILPDLDPKGAVIKSGKEEIRTRLKNVYVTD